MEYQGLTCFICFCEYGDGDRLPRIIPDCGHTICSSCLFELLQTRNFKCPLDNSPFPKNHNSVEDFKINFSLKHLIEEKEDELCHYHQEKLRLLCYTDRVRICDDCALFGDHVGHKVESIKQARPRLEKNKKAITEALKLVEQNNQQIDIILKESETSFVKTIKDRFEQLRWVLSHKEGELLGSVTQFFSGQKKLITDYLESSYGLKSDIIKRLSSLKDSMATVDPFSFLLEESNAFVTSKFNGEVVEKYFSDLKLKFKGTLQSFSETLANQVVMISKISLPEQGSVEQIASLLTTPGGEQLPSEQKKENLTPQIKTVFEVKMENDLLHVIADDKERENININMTDLKRVNKVKLSLNKYNWTDIDMNVLFSIWTSFENVLDLEIWCNPKEIFDSALCQILPVIFWKPQDLVSLKIDFSECEIGDEVGIFLMKKVLPKFVTLQRLSLSFCNTHITTKTFKAFHQSNLVFLQSLETLELNLERTDVKDKGLVELLCPMPNLRTMSLNLMYNTSISDQSIQVLINNTLCTANKIESFKILLGGTVVTHNSVNKLFANLENVKEFVLGLGNVKTSHLIVETFATQAAPTMKFLENLELRLSYNKEINDDSLMFLWTAIKKMNLKRIALSIFETGITDSGIRGLAEAVLISGESLNAFELWVSGQKVTDKGIITLLQSLPDLKELILHLGDMNISDKTGEELINVLPRMKSMVTMDIKLPWGLLSKNISNRILQRAEKFNKEVNMLNMSPETNINVIE